MPQKCNVQGAVGHDDKGEISQHLQSPRRDGEDRRSGMTLALPASLTPGESGPIAKARSAQPPVAAAPAAGGPRVTRSCGSMRCMRHTARLDGTAAALRVGDAAVTAAGRSLVRMYVSPALCPRQVRRARQCADGVVEHERSTSGETRREHTQHLGPKKPSSGAWEDEAQQAGRDGQSCNLFLFLH